MGSIIKGVCRGKASCLVLIPLAIAGSLTAHGLTYRIVAPDAGARASLLRETGHGYLDRLPLALGILGALLLAGLVLRIRAAGDPDWRLRARLAFAVPLLAFALQEHLERLVHSGSFPLGAALEPTFLIGLGLQLPFALAAYAIAVWLLEAAGRLGAVLTRARPLGLPRAERQLPRPRTAVPPRVPALALGHATRGPPLLGG
jgi:hypothetical protein